MLTNKLPKEAAAALVKMPAILLSLLKLFLFLSLLIAPCNPSYTMSRTEQTYIMIKVNNQLSTDRLQS